MTLFHTKDDAVPGLLMRVGAAPLVTHRTKTIELVFDLHDAMHACVLAKALDSVLLEKYGSHAVTALLQDYLTGTVYASLQAITQRISRESAEKCARVETIAKRFVQELVDHQIGLVYVDGAEFLDQASVRMIKRLEIRMRRAGIRLEIQARANLFAEPNTADIAARIVAAAWRAAFPTWVDASTADLLEPLSRLDCKVDADTAIADLIALQAFDIAVVALGSNEVADKPATPMEARRIIATILVNCGWHHEALQQLDLAASLVLSDPHSLSRILYTKGLVLAKRMAALDGAEKLFYQGIRLIADAGLSDTADGRLTHAWHLNGLALIAALRARLAIDKHEKNRMLAHAASFLNRAKPLIARSGSQPAIYLEDNLTANGVMLREMNGEHDAARRRFVEKFAKFANAQSARQPFVFYHFRVAGLKYRAGDAHGALEDLVESRRNALACQAEHAIGRIDLARSVALSSLGRLDEACDCLDFAIEDAEEREAFGLLAAAANQAKSISQSPGDRADLLGRAAASLRNGFDQHRPVPAFPSKLPSYVPYIDLLCDTDSTNEKLTAPRHS